MKKSFVNIPAKSTFDTLKRSASPQDDSYIIGSSTTPVEGIPDIYWRQICFIEDTGEIYTIGRMFNGDTYTKSEIDEKLGYVSDELDEILGE